MTVLLVPVALLLLWGLRASWRAPRPPSRRRLKRNDRLLRSLGTVDTRRWR